VHAFSHAEVYRSRKLVGEQLGPRSAWFLTLRSISAKIVSSPFFFFVVATGFFWWIKIFNKRSETLIIWIAFRYAARPDTSGNNKRGARPTTRRQAVVIVATHNCFLLCILFIPSFSLFLLPFLSIVYFCIYAFFFFCWYHFGE